MVAKILTMKNKHKFFCILFFLTNALCFAESTYVIGAERFRFTRGQESSSVGEAAAEMFPVGILEKMGETMSRAILPDEKLERKRFELQKERITLYSSLASEYRKRDSLFLNDYSALQLKKKLAEKDKSIKEIQDKIDSNLKSLREAEIECTENLKTIEGQNFTSDNEDSKSELRKYVNLFKHVFSKEEDLVTFEDIKFYNNDFTSLFSPSESAKKAGYDSYAFEKEVVAAKINTLLTGTITNYGDYFSVVVTAYSYPGNKNLGTVMEIGTLQESDLLVENLARQLIPLISNSLPVSFNLNLQPAEAYVHVYIDDVIHYILDSEIVLNSGVHTLQFVADGYKTCRTEYFFEGNKKYNIEVQMEPVEEGFVMLGLLKPLDGIVYANGIAAEEINRQKSKIMINGNNIIGEFISDNGESAFYYIPEKMIYDGSFVYINPKTFDRNEYLEKRRKIMYGSYSLLITSLIPSFYIYGRYFNEAKKYNDQLGNYEEAIKWQNISQTSARISAGFGVFFAFELVRYLIAANSVLPQEAKIPGKNAIKKINSSDFSSVMPEEKNFQGTDSAENSEIIKSIEENEQ